MEMKCLECSTRFSIPPAWIRKGGGKFCSRRCSAIFNNSVSMLNSARKALGISGGRPKNRVVLRCQVCSIEFEVTKSESDRKTCSMKCRSGLVRPKRIKKKRPSIRGKNHYNWKGELRKANRFRYTAEYSDWRLAVFKRDRYICVICGIKNRDGKRVEIHADHILSLALHPELGLDISNGRTLCVFCHRKTKSYGVKKCKQQADLFE